jgi:hypothetical protein
MVRKKRLGLGAAITVAALSVAGIAYAQIPSGGVISGCYTRSGGPLRVVDPSTTKCRSGETSLQWNQQGAPGKDGTNGTNGTNGKDGAPGTNGKDGAPGTNGTNGTNGVSGYTTQHHTFVLDPNTSKMDEILCPTGTRPLGGGGHLGNVFSDKGIGYVTYDYLVESDINDTKDGWAITVVNKFSQPAEFSTDVICAAV